jgi:hypothetical protein
MIELSKKLKKPTLWIILFPLFAFGQTPAKTERTEDDPKTDRSRMFKGIFSGGFTTSQVDGDQTAGYFKFGGLLGVGTLVKFHKNMSVSLELMYNMRGAKRRPSLNDPNIPDFKTIYDYLEVPICFNVHDKKLVMFSAGLMPGVLVRFKEYVNGQDVTDNPRMGEPRRFDLSAVAGLTFLIKGRYGIGGRFSYSLLSLRNPDPESKARGQFHNVISFRLMYLLEGKQRK